MRSTRRGFLGIVASAGAWLARPVAAAAATTATPPPSPTPAPPPLAAGLARERFGKFLSAEETKLLEDRLGGQERRSGRLRSFKLANGEEPATDFHTTRSLGGGERTLRSLGGAGR